MSHWGAVTHARGIASAQAESHEADGLPRGLLHGTEGDGLFRQTEAGATSFLAEALSAVLIPKCRRKTPYTGVVEASRGGIAGAAIGGQD
jgi:hypothetical protein